MARVIVKTISLSHEDWLGYRRKGLGGSDASTVCGLNPYSSKLTLWADKTGRLPEKEDNEAMRTGRDLEQYVASRFEEATGKRVHRKNAMFAHDKYDFITANVDREVVGENAGLECKTTSAYARSDFENGEVPLNYLCQCRHYMNVMGYDKMYLAVLVMGRAFYWFEIPYDKAEGDALLKMEIDFGISTSFLMSGLRLTALTHRQTQSEHCGTRKLKKQLAYSEMMQISTSILVCRSRRKLSKKR